MALPQRVPQPWLRSHSRTAVFVDVPARTRRTGVSRVLVATDFSAAADSTWQTALELAVDTGAALTIVHVVDAFSEAFVRHNDALLDAADALLLAVERRIDQLVREGARAGVTCAAAVAVGHPAIEIARAVTAADADVVLVASSHGEAGPFGATWGPRVAGELSRLWRRGRA